jgi:hypothetical protein
MNDNDKECQSFNLSFSFAIIYIMISWTCSMREYKLFTFLSVDMEILTPWRSQVHPEAQPKGVQATQGC